MQEFPQRLLVAEQAFLYKILDRKEKYIYISEGKQNGSSCLKYEVIYSGLKRNGIFRLI